MINKDKVLGKTFISGPLAMTEIANGGTIFGIIYYQYLNFSSECEVIMTNKVVYNKGMKDWETLKENQIWIGTYSLDSDNKHIKCELKYMKLRRLIYVDFIDDQTLLCEGYFMDEKEGKGLVFTTV
jgi:hypothetical protein